MAAPPEPADSTAQAAAAWLEALLAASRPEATWTPSALVASLKWAEAVEELAACPAPADGSSTALSSALAAPALSAPLALLGAPRATHARQELLTALLRSLQLTHGARVTPLLHALEADCAKGMGRLDATLGRAVTAIAAILAPGGAQDGGESVRDAAAFFLARQTSAFCVACAEPVPHEPATHLVEADVCAAAAAASVLHRALPAGAWAAALDALPVAAAAEACCLRLALAVPAASREEAAAGPASEDDEDDADDGDDWDGWADASADAWLAPCRAVGAYVMRRLGLHAAAGEDDGGGEESDDSWRTVPPWLLSLACGAHAPLCDAYVRALIRPRRGASVDLRREAAARLRCVLAAGGRGARRARATLRAWGCLYASPPDAKRQRMSA